MREYYQVSMPIGEILSLTSAITWGISVSLFKIIGNTLSPYILNPVKNTIGSILFLITCLLFTDSMLINELDQIISGCDCGFDVVQLHLNPE